MKKAVAAILFLTWALPGIVRADDAAVLKQIQLLNQIPEDQMNEKTDPAFSILRALYDQDGPDFLTLRKLVGKAEIRSHLNPSARCVIAGVISQRWDTFALSGNLYLSGLQSKNPDLRQKAREKLVYFIQPAHIPALIDLLKIPGPNVLAYEVLQEVTGQKMDPTIKKWQTWWLRGGSKSDLIGHLLKDTQKQMSSHVIRDFDQERYWYLPMGLDDAAVPYSKRSDRDQIKISDWNNWVNTDVGHYVEQWSVAKPILDRIKHQPDPRVNKFLETLATDPGYGDYASVILAWRASAASLPVIEAAYQAKPTVGRALARGTLGDKTALDDLLVIMERHASQPLSYKIMNDDARNMMDTLRTLGIVPAEQAFQLMCHQNFDFESAMTSKEKKKEFKKAKNWLKENINRLTFDRRRGYFAVPSSK